LAVLVAGPAATGSAQTTDPWVAEVVPHIEPHYELWAGGEATKHYWSLWSGGTIAPFAPITADGWRLRAVGGGGAYSYDSRRIVAGRLRPQRFHAVTAFTDGLVGYQMRLGAWTVKPFAGISHQEHRIHPRDPFNPRAGSGTGVKLLVENWLVISAVTWASLDASWGSVNDAYWSRARLGWRALRDILPGDDLSIGIEAGAIGDKAHDVGRAGAFVRYVWPRGELSVSGGVSGDYDNPRDSYAGASLMVRF
jgi:hypothetical protein